jgi:hypothetical protein
MIKRRNRPNWVHYSFGGYVQMLKRNANGETTACGKTAQRISVTKDKNNVTCPLCLEKLKEDNWFCEDHKFLDDIDVTFDEKCGYCGKRAVA